MELCKLFIIIITLNIKSTSSLTSSKIPTLLIPCYNGNFSMENRPPLTIPILVELVRKIELYEKTTINLRILVTSLLHQIIFDGVLRSERNDGIFNDDALPFRARGPEFNKYKLVVDYFVSGESTLNVNESLVQDELCYLHNMLSITTEGYFRGDEDVTCSYNQTKLPVLSMGLQPENLIQSKCPLMKGGLSTKWGSITPSHLVYGLSSILQNTQTSFENIIHSINSTKSRNDINSAKSIWISTLAADLADAILNQANTNLIIGTPGAWNDTVLPANYYLSNHFSDMTETELLGGIDGLIIGAHVEHWQNILMSTRFSQIIDMFYSRRGICFNTTIRASNRNVVFNQILKSVNLTQQIIGTAKLLKEMGAHDRFLTDKEIEELATFTEESFEDLSDEITKRYDTIEHVNDENLSNNLEILLVLGGDFDFYTSKRIIYSLIESAQISFYGNKMGILNGQTGEWISNVTGEIFDIFRCLDRHENSWPTQLSLHLPFETIISYYQNSTNKCTSSGGSKKPLGRAIVILSNNARPTDDDVYKYKETLSSIKNVHPETNIVFALPESVQRNFQDLSNLYKNDTMVELSNDVVALSNTIMNVLTKIPSQIVNIFCESRLEDYLTPSVEKFYEIHQEYTGKYNFEIKFTGNDYGDILICVTNQTDGQYKTCRYLTVNDEVTYNSNDLCSKDSKCNLQFILNVNKSNFKCAENDCRYPDQVRLDIVWTKSGSSISKSTPSTYLTISLILSFFVTIS